MSAGWVACSVRSRAMTRRRLGYEAARTLAACASLEQAKAALLHSPYRHGIRQEQSLVEAQRAVVDTLLWNVRVLAGWAPGAGVTMLRALASPLVAVNVQEHLWRLAGVDQPAPYQLGALSSAWPRLAECATGHETRRVLAASAWGDPGTDVPREIVLAMRVTAADRIVASAPGAAGWAIAGVALLVAREVIRDGHELPARARAVGARVLGRTAISAMTLPELTAALSPSARWVLDDVSADGLWHAESRWWRRVEQEAFPLAHHGIAGPDVLLGSVALLALDAWRVRAALELAARGGTPLEAFDAVA